MLAEHPDALAERLIKKASSAVFDPVTTAASTPNVDQLDSLMTKLVFLVGHVALRQLVHSDAVLTELKRRRAIQEEQSHKQKQAAAAQKKKATSEEEDMGVAGASAEDTDAEFMTSVSERELLFDPAALLTAYAPLVEAICRAPGRFQNVELQSAAVLSLTKFMCTSSLFCEANLQLLFTILKTSPFAQVRSNAIIALGDLAFRFPNLLEPWTPLLYSP
jgi:condensin complex subunit 1